MYSSNHESVSRIDSFPPRGKGRLQSSDERLSPNTIKLIEEYNSTANRPGNAYSQQNAPLSGNKVILVGDQQVGKTSLFVRISKGLFNTTYRPTIGLDFQVKKYTVFGVPFNLTIWFVEALLLLQCTCTCIHVYVRMEGKVLTNPVLSPILLLLGTPLVKRDLER